MTTAGSLFCAFAKPLAELTPPSKIADWIKTSPVAELWIASAVLFLLSAYRVWQRERRNRLAVALENLLETSRSLARRVREFKGRYGLGEDYYVLSTPSGSRFEVDRERCLESVAILYRTSDYQIELRKALDDIGRTSVRFSELSQAHKFYHLAEGFAKHEQLIASEILRLRNTFWLIRDKQLEPVPTLQKPSSSGTYGSGGTYA